MTRKHRIMLTICTVLLTLVLSLASCDKDSGMESQTQLAEETTDVESETVHEHTYTDTVTAPTCTAQGYTTHTCSRCGQSYADSFTKATGHTPGAEADCTLDQTCTVCGAVIQERLGHEYVAEVTEPTCTAQGYTTHTCSRCGQSYADSFTKATGHTPGAEADCTHDQTCIVCGVVLKTKLGHTYKATIMTPTCTEQGHTTHTCTVCGDSYIDSYTRAMGHTPGAEADCTHDQTCTVCGVVLKAKLGHTYADTVTAPTCAEQGYTTHTCNICDYSYADNYTAINPDAHHYVNYICTHCGNEMPTSSGLEYRELSDGTYEVSGIGTCRDIDVVIPLSYNGKPVTSISDEAFWCCEHLERITMPNSVTSIGGGAFVGCVNLMSITISDSVISIGAGAFLDCWSLISINIPNSVTSIGDMAFSGCSSLSSVTIGDSVTSIGMEAFFNCTSLTSVTIGNSVTSIGGYAFRQCTSLTSIIIPGSVGSISNSIFIDCTSLKNATIGDGVTAIAAEMFMGCVNLTSISIPDSVTSIGGHAFHQCTSLTSISIPNSVTSIDDSAFIGCINLTSITIPGSVTFISAGAFMHCRSLTSITIPDGVTSIGGVAFKNCRSLTSITIPDSVTSIGGGAFEGCVGLTGITIPNSVTSIDEDAFSWCISLADVYYTGTKAQWNNILIGGGNTDLTSATIHCTDGDIN